MVRKKEFDTEEVLDKATDLFWKKGYGNTSIQDLVEHLGLARGSLYNAFENKHSLFLAVLDHYLLRRNAEYRRILNRDSPRDAFDSLFGSFIDEIMEDHEQKGCLIINTTTELAAHDPEVAERVNRSQKQQVDCFSEALQTAIEKGHLSPELDPRALALFFSNTMKGLRVMARISPSRDELVAVVNTALKVLE